MSPGRLVSGWLVAGFRQTRRTQFFGNQRHDFSPKLRLLFVQLPNNTWRDTTSEYMLFASCRKGSPSIPDKQKASIDVAMSVTGFLMMRSKNAGIFELVVWISGGE